MYNINQSEYNGIITLSITDGGKIYTINEMDKEPAVFKIAGRNYTKTAGGKKIILNRLKEELLKCRLSNC